MNDIDELEKMAFVPWWKFWLAGKKNEAIHKLAKKSRQLQLELSQQSAITTRTVMAFGNILETKHE